MAPFLKKILCLCIFRKKEGDREGEKHQCVVASCIPPTGDLAHNPGMCPDWKQNQDPLVRRPVLNPWSHTSQGFLTPFMTFWKRKNQTIKIISGSQEFQRSRQIFQQMKHRGLWGDGGGSLQTVQNPLFGSLKVELCGVSTVFYRADSQQGGTDAPPGFCPVRRPLCRL